MEGILAQILDQMYSYMQQLAAAKRRIQELEQQVAELTNPDKKVDD